MASPSMQREAHDRLRLVSDLRIHTREPLIKSRAGATAALRDAAQDAAAQTVVIPRQADAARRCARNAPSHPGCGEKAASALLRTLRIVRAIRLRRGA